MSENITPLRDNPDNKNRIHVVEYNNKEFSDIEPSDICELKTDRKNTVATWINVYT